MVIIVSAGSEVVDELPLRRHCRDNVEVVDFVVCDLRNLRQVGGGTVVREKVGDSKLGAVMMVGV